MASPKTVAVSTEQVQELLGKERGSAWVGSQTSLNLRPRGKERELAGKVKGGGRCDERALREGLGDTEW